MVAPLWSQRANQVFAGVGLLICAGVAVWTVVWFAEVISNANPSVQAALTAGAVTIVVLIATYMKETARARREAHREKKIEVYSLYYDIVFDTLEKSRGGGELIISDEFNARWMALSRGVVFYGSPSVVRALTAFKAHANDKQQNALDPIRRAGRILLAMREDIGLSNAGLDDLSIHQIYISDNLAEVGKAG